MKYNYKHSSAMAESKRFPNNPQNNPSSLNGSESTFNVKQIFDIARKFNHLDRRLTLNPTTNGNHQPKDTKTSLQRKELAKTINKCKTAERKNSLNLTRSKSFTSLNNVSRTPMRQIRAGRWSSQTQAIQSPAVHHHTKSTESREGRSEYVMVSSSTERLVKGLGNWLGKRGKPMIFKSLKKLSLKLSKQESGVNSPESLSFSSKSSVSQEEVCAENDKRVLLKGALEDLRKLIAMGFPWQDSRAWLAAMKSCYGDIHDEPLYWECVALLQNATPHKLKEKETNFTDQIGKLEKKFENLEITSPAVNSKTRRGNRPALCQLDLNNVLESTEINFVVRSVGCEDPQIVVTPVRRGMRRQVPTSSGKTCSSFFSLSPETQKKAVFKPNKNLDF